MVDISTVQHQSPESIRLITLNHEAAPYEALNEPIQDSPQ
jgi:hypothetical protein